MKYLDPVCQTPGLSPEYSSESRELASIIARKAAASKAKYPVDYSFTREIRRYRLL
jgi:hypothetical protein